MYIVSYSSLYFICIRSQKERKKERNRNRNCHSGLSISEVYSALNFKVNVIWSASLVA